MIDHKQYPISITEVLRAKKTVYKHLSPTSLHYYDNLSSLIGAAIYIKHENHNPTGSFKIRGGVNLMHHLSAAKVAGVVTFSTGNHGLSIAQSAGYYDIEATIVVPKGNNRAKNRAIVATGAQLIEAGDTFEEASLVVEELVRERSLYYVHPANEPHLINGVGTEFVEILETVPDIDAVIVPVGAGSEAAAASVAFKALKPTVEIYGVQATSSCAAYRSWKSKKIVSSENRTFAGGFATGTGYEVPFGFYKDSLTDFVLLSEDEIYEGIALAGYYTHNLLEGAGASTIMAAIKLKDRLQGKKVALQFSGCNGSATEVQQAYQRPSFSKGWG